MLLTLLASVAYLPDSGEREAQEPAISTHPGETSPAGETSPVAQALKRLTAAVADLEAAVDRRAGGLDDEHRTGLHAARAEAQALRATHEAVSERLDAAIGRLHSLLKE